MSDTMVRRVRAAASAGWWTVLVGVVWLAGGWGIWICLSYNQPEWMLRLWGKGVTWPEAQELVLETVACLKLILFSGVLACIFLSIWAGKLRKIDQH